MHPASAGSRLAPVTQRRCGAAMRVARRLERPDRHRAVRRDPPKPERPGARLTACARFYRERPRPSRPMHTGSLLALAAVLLVAVPALAARPPAGAKYRGMTSQDRAVSARVTSDAKGLQIEFNQVLGCNRGPTKATQTIYRDKRPTIREDGTFEYFKTYRNLAPVPGFNERHTERQRVTGNFTADGTRVKVRVATSVVGVSGLRCRATVTFTARKRS